MRSERAAAWTALAALTAATAAIAGQLGGRPSHAPRPLSFHNRILLNRAALAGLSRVQVMAAVTPDVDSTEAIATASARVIRSVPDVGYLRLELPLDRVVAFGADPAIAAFQIVTLSKSSWQRDGPPRLNAETFRGFWSSPVLGRTSSPPAHDDMPLLTAEEAATDGFTGDADTGLAEWRRLHPAFDGRGVTVALLELAQPDFGNPAFQRALALDGTPVPKIAGVVNAIDDDEPDDTRVELDVPVVAAGTWARIGGRWYTLPHPGRFHAGRFSLPAGGNVVHEFMVVADDASGGIFVDTNGDGDLRGETPVADVNERWDVRWLTLAHPRPGRVAFVVARGRRGGVVHVYAGRGAHETMTLSVLAGAPPGGGVGTGVAPGARVLLVRHHTFDYGPASIVEGFLAAAARPDVDVLVDASGLEPGPDTAGDFFALIFDRMVTRYGKPIFHSANNLQSWLASSSSLGGVFTVGGSLGPATFAAFYGPDVIGRTVVHHAGASGPALDGALKPDFLAPMHRIAATLPADAVGSMVPLRSPRARLPNGYRVSCCTSASAPYAAGLAARLIGAARLTGLRVSLDSLRRALVVGARTLEDAPAHQQGNGIIDLDAAWRELNASIDPPRIQVEAPVVHKLAQYAAHPGGTGLFEVEGWSKGASGRRSIRLRRETGPDAPVAYRVSWTGNDGTFSAPVTVDLPLGTAIALPVGITARNDGAYSAILNLHDPRSNTVVFRTAATVVAAPDLTGPQHQAELVGSVDPMRTTAHYFHVPPGTTVLAVDMEVLAGTLTAALAPPTLLVPVEYPHTFPQFGRSFPAGRYSVAVPLPAEGVWSVDIANVSARIESDASLVSTIPARYRLVVRAYGADLRVEGRGGLVDVDVTGAPLREPVVRVSQASHSRHAIRFDAHGLPRSIEIAVPPGADVLRLLARSPGPSVPIEIHLYDCTTGECFSHAVTMPADVRQELYVRHPSSGRWVAAVYPAPVPVAEGEASLDVTVGSAPFARVRMRSTGAHAALTAALPSSVSTESLRSGEAWLIEVIDEALERDQRELRWETRPAMPDFRTMPVAIASTTLEKRER